MTEELFTLIAFDDLEPDMKLVALPENYEGYTCRAFVLFDGTLVPLSEDSVSEGNFVAVITCGLVPYALPASPRPFSMTPFVWQDPATLTPRCVAPDWFTGQTIEIWNEHGERVRLVLREQDQATVRAVEAKRGEPQ